MKSFHNVIFFTSLLISPIVFASDTYEQVLVSASLTETTAFDVLGSATVISSEDIDHIQPVDFAEVLGKQAGLDISRTGGSLSATSLFLRGSNNGHTLFLINGHRFNSATLGESQFQLIDPEQIARIEVVRGARSSIHGSDAIGGVVNIITKQATDEFSGFVSGQYGSFNTGKASVGVGDLIGKFGYQVSLAVESSDGIDNQVNDDGGNSDDDAYEIFNINAFLEYEVSEHLNLNFSHLESQSESDYDSWTQTEPFTDNVLRISTFDVKATPTDIYSTIFSLSASRDESIQKDHDPGSDHENSEITTTREVARWSNFLELIDGYTITAGLEFTGESISGDIDHTEEQRDNTAGFIQFEGAVGDFDLQLGGRNDDSSDYGSVDTYTAGIGFDPSDDVRVYATYSEGFKAPTFNDLWWPPGMFSAGNPDVVPEESISREMGAKLKNGPLYAEVSIYNNDVINLIDWSPNSDGVWVPTNIASADLKGHDILVGLNEDDWKLELSYSRSDARDSSSNTRLANRAKHKLSIDISRTFNDLALGAIFLTQSERMASSPIRENSPGYAIYDIYTSYNVLSDLRLGLKVNNLFDREYEYDERYNAERRNVSAKLTYTF